MLFSATLKGIYVGSLPLSLSLYWKYWWKRSITSSVEFSLKPVQQEFEEYNIGLGWQHLPVNLKIWTMWTDNFPVTPLKSFLG